MTKQIQAVVFLSVTALLLAACAVTPYGKAVQAVDTQRHLVLRSQIEFEKLHLQGKLQETDYRAERILFDRWATAETAATEALVAWRATQTAEASTRLDAALAALRPTLQALLDLVGKFVDLPTIQKQLAGS